MQIVLDFTKFCNVTIHFKVPWMMSDPVSVVQGGLPLPFR